MKAFKPHNKKCRNTACRQSFRVETPNEARATWCSTDCALAIVAAKRVKAKAEKDKRERAENRAAKEKVKRKSDHAQDTQDAINAWVRERDYFEPCISCRTTANVQYAAGHYRTVGACPELRFEPLNIHKQCNWNCNQNKSGNLVEYRINLVKKIGAENVEWLEGPHPAKHYTVDELKALGKHYRALTRQLQKARERGERHAEAPS